MKVFSVLGMDSGVGVTSICKWLSYIANGCHVKAVVIDAVYNRDIINVGLKDIVDLDDTLTINAIFNQAKGDKPISNLDKLKVAGADISNFKGSVFGDVVHCDTIPFIPQVEPLTDSSNMGKCIKYLLFYLESKGYELLIFDCGVGVSARMFMRALNSHSNDPLNFIVGRRGQLAVLDSLAGANLGFLDKTCFIENKVNCGDTEGFPDGKPYIVRYDNNPYSTSSFSNGALEDLYIAFKSLLSEEDDIYERILSGGKFLARRLQELLKYRTSVNYRLMCNPLTFVLFMLTICFLFLPFGFAIVGYGVGLDFSTFGLPEWFWFKYALLVTIFAILTILSNKTYNFWFGDENSRILNKIQLILNLERR